jgi:hypothetical protein
MASWKDFTSSRLGARLTSFEEAHFRCGTPPAQSSGGTDIDRRKPMPMFKRTPAPLAMIVSKERYSQGAFVLGQEDIRRLEYFFQHFVERPTFEIECRDGSNETFASSSQLLSFANTRSRMIRSLWIRATNDEQMSRARVRFSNLHAPVYLELSGERGAMARLQDAIARQLERMHPSLMPKTALDCILAVLAGLGLAAAGATLGSCLANGLHAGGMFDFSRPGLRILARVLFIDSGCLGLCLAAAWFARPSGFLFPAAAFALGRGQGRQYRQTILRCALIAGLAASLVAALILNFL